MGPENSNGPVVAYIDGQPVVIDQPLPEITLDYSAGGISAEEASAGMAAMSKIWADLHVKVEVAAEDVQAIFDGLELGTAVWLARAFKPKLFRHYLHTKKKRIRKKYEKRILTWFRRCLCKC